MKVRCMRLFGNNKDLKYRCCWEWKILATFRLCWKRIQQHTNTPEPWWCRLVTISEFGFRRPRKEVKESSSTSESQHSRKEAMREDQPKNGKLEGNVDGSYHEKVDFLILGEAKQKKDQSQKVFRKADFLFIHGELTHNILWETTKKKKDLEL